jgi:hypothetical protein
MPRLFTSNGSRKVVTRMAPASKSSHIILWRRGSARRKPRGVTHWHQQLHKIQEPYQGRKQQHHTDCLSVAQHLIQAHLAQPQDEYPAYQDQPDKTLCLWRLGPTRSLFGVFGRLSGKSRSPSLVCPVSGELGRSVARPAPTHTSEPFNARVRGSTCLAASRIPGVGARLLKSPR